MWLSGSNRALIEQGLQDALAGRVTLKTLHPLSLQELEATNFDVTPDTLFMKGGWPKLHANPSLFPPLLSQRLSAHGQCFKRFRHFKRLWRFGTATMPGLKGAGKGAYHAYGREEKARMRRFNSQKLSHAETDALVATRLQ